MSHQMRRLDKYGYIEILIKGRGLSAESKASVYLLLSKHSIPLAQLASTDYKGLFQVCYYTRSFSKAEQLLRDFRKHRIKGSSIRVKTLQRHDWFDKWKLDYHIRPLGKKFMIVPLWEKKQFRAERREPVYLDPAGAFGSGYHETTRLMVNLLETIPRPIKNFLDIGTGTGILAIIASKLGAEKIAAFDNDKPSVTAARVNFELNQCRGGTFFCAQLKRLKLRERYDVVGANLISKVLTAYKEKILARVAPGGLLLVSGISKENAPGFQKGFADPGLKLLKVLRSRKWVALAYRKNKH